MNTSKKTTIVRLVQINQPHLGKFFLPYSAGLLEAYVQQYAQSQYLFLPPLYRRVPLVQALQELQFADVVGFSVYAWNIQYSLTLARELKQQKPEVLIVFGGPQVPDRVGDFLQNNPFIDICCHGEGEAVFLNILESGGDWSEIPGVSYRDPSGQWVQHAKAPQTKNLSRIPSPYLSGTFEPLMKAHPEQGWIALWETNRGCPFSCTFCDWGSAVQSKVRAWDMARLKSEIDWFSNHKIEVVFSCDANFGILKQDVAITHEMVRSYRDIGYPNKFIIQGTKNLTERAYQIHLKLDEAQMTYPVTLSLQTLSPDALADVKRENISMETYRELQRRFRRDGVKTYTDLIIGLPGETYDSFANGVNQLISEGQLNRIQFFNLYVLPNAEMGDPVYRQQHGIETVMSPYVFSMGDEAEGQVEESLEMVIATASMSRDNWVRARTLGWLTDLLLLNRKMLQIPFVLLHEQVGMSYREILEWLMDNKDLSSDIFTDIQVFLKNKARGIQNGEPAYSCLNIAGGSPVWLEPCDYVMTGLLRTGALEQFYEDSFQLLKQWAQNQDLLMEAIALNKALFLSQALNRTFCLPMNYNLWDFYQGVIKGQPCELKRESVVYIKDWLGEPYFEVRKDVN